MPAFNVPTVNIGSRQKGRLAAISVIDALPNQPSIQTAIHTALTGTYNQVDEQVHNPYGQGDTSTQIIDMIKALKFNPSKAFYDLK